MNKRPFLAVISDDLTGAGDIASVLAQFGISAFVITDVASVGDIQSDSDAVIINTETRNTNPKKAYDKVLFAAQLIKNIKPEYIFKKTDSTLRGYIASELDALIETFELKEIPFIPAYPKMERFTKNFNQYVGKKKLLNTFYASDPRNPVRHSSVIEAVSNKSAYKEKIILFNIRNQKELKDAANKLDHRVVAGSSGFLEEMLKVWLKISNICNKRMDIKFSFGDVLTVNGSLNPVSKMQADSLQNRFKFSDLRSLRVSPLKRAASLILLDSSKWPKLSPKAAGDKILSLAQKTNELYNLKYLVISGGETAYNLCRIFGIIKLSLICGFSRGVAVFKAQNGQFVVLKSGGFGRKDFFIRVVKDLLKI